MEKERENKEERKMGGKEKREKDLGCSGFRESKPEFVVLSIFRKNFIFELF